MRSFLFFLLAVVSATASLAQDTLAYKQLTETVVSATRTERDPNEVGRSITVISQDEIKKSGVNSLAELLARQEGIYVIGAGQNPGMTSSIFTRGSNSNQTVILIDGVRVTDPSAINNAIDLSELSLVNIDRIEIVRGSHSTLYGSSAIGGVVNIITRKPSKPGLSADAAVTAGTFGAATSLLTENLRLSYALKGGFYAGLELLNTGVKGLDATLDTTTDPVYRHEETGDNFKKLDWVAKAGFRNAKWDVYASFKQTSQLADIDKGAYNDDDNYTVDFKRSLLTYGASFRLNEHFDLAYIGGLSAMKRTAIDDSSLVDVTGNFDRTYSEGIHEGKILSNELQANYSTKGLNLVLGGGMYSEEMKANTSFLYFNPFGFPPDYVELKTSTDTIDPHSSTGNIFLHADLSGALLSDNAGWANLSGGLRMSSHSVFGTNFTYEINPSIKLGNGGLLYAAYATGFNAPSLYQLYDPTQYYTWDMQYTNGLTRGNKKLSPEQSGTFEVGYKQQIGDLVLSAAYFNTVVKDVIEYVYLWDGNIGIDTLGQNWGRDDYRGDTYINLGTMTTNGVELSLQSRISDKWSVAANLSLVSGKLEYEGSDIDTAQTGGAHVQVYGNGAFITDKDVQVLGLSRRPNTANLSITYTPIKRLALRGDVRYAGSRGDVYYESSLGPYGALGTVAVEQYTLFDLSLTANIYKGLSAHIRVENLLDKKYYEINGFTTRGRGFYLTVRYTL